MSDFLRDQTSGELAGWLAYLRIDDEVQTQRMAVSILKANGKQRPAQQMDDDEDGPPIDTTDPNFAKQFGGFINKPGQSQGPMRPMRSTEILKG